MTPITSVRKIQTIIKMILSYNNDNDQHNGDNDTRNNNKNDKTDLD